MQFEGNIRSSDLTAIRLTAEKLQREGEITEFGMDRIIDILSGIQRGIDQRRPTKTIGANHHAYKR